MKKLSYTLGVLSLGLILVGAGCSQSADINTSAEVDTENSNEQQMQQKDDSNNEEDNMEEQQKDNNNNSGEDMNKDNTSDSKTESGTEVEINAEAGLNAESSNEMDSEDSEDMDNSETSSSDSEMKVVNVSGTEFDFSPSNITVDQEQKVKINFTNEGNVAHDLKIPSLGVGTSVIEAGATESFTFTAEESGTYPMEFECTVPGHAQQGMAGKIIVE